MELPKRRILMNAFFKAHLIVVMLPGCFIPISTNRLHERSLRITDNDKHSTFEELLAKNNSVSVHHKNIHAIAIEMYKVVNGISPKIMNEVFKFFIFHNFLL